MALIQVMRMTAAGVVGIPQAADLSFHPVDDSWLSLDHGSTWDVRPGLRCPVSSLSFSLATGLTLIIPSCPSICPVDTILTRMGAYDNMFSNASTFKVELDEWYVSSSPKFLGSLRVDAHLFPSIQLQDPQGCDAQVISNFGW